MNSTKWLDRVIDWLSKIAIPIVLFLAGQQFNSQQDTATKHRDDLEKESLRKRWVLERYTSIAPFLSSNNPKLRKIGIGFLTTIRAEDSDNLPIYQTLLAYATDPDSAVAQTARQAIGLDQSQAAAKIVAAAKINTTYTMPPLTTDTKDWELPSDVQIFRISATKLLRLSGVTGGKNGRVITLVNVGKPPIWIGYDTSSEPQNRFRCSSIALGIDAQATFWYDGTSKCWRYQE